MGPLPLDRADIPDALELNLRVAVIDTMNGMEPVYPSIYNIIDTEKAIERELVAYGLGLVPLSGENQNPTYDHGGEAWNASYTPNLYALGQEVSWIAIDDDIHGVIAELIKQGGNIADVANYTMELNAMTPFNNAETSTFYTAGGTAYTMLSTAQFMVTGSTYANTTTNAIDLSEEALEMWYGFWRQNLVNQRGQKTLERIRTLMCSSTQKMLADRIVNTKDRRPESADNDINPINSWDLNVIESPLMSTDGRYFLFGRKESTQLRWYRRMDFTVRRYPSPDNGNLRFVGLYREAHGGTSPFNIAGSTP